MIIEINGHAVVDSDSLDSQGFEDTEITFVDEDEDVTINSDGPVSITIRHDGTEERII
jgi:hypothetical protein